jgi:uncharacterized protein YbjT (DUF2867 family)
MWGNAVGIVLAMLALPLIVTCFNPDALLGSFASSNASNPVSNHSIMKIGVIGSGDVAQILAAGFLKHGHSVTIGTRSPEKLAAWSAANPSATVGSFADAAAFAEVAVIAVKVRMHAAARPTITCSVLRARRANALRAGVSCG